MVATADHLNNVRNHLDSYFKQIRDIDLNVPPYNQGLGWEPIGLYSGSDNGDNNPFTGVYDGSGFAISNLYINRPDYSFNGLFRYTFSANLTNMSLTNCSMLGYVYDGCLVAIADSTFINNCHITGTISVQNTDGLLAGRVRNSTIVGCTSKGSLTSVCWDSGGLIGRAENSTITRCYAGVTVSGSSWTGGFIGYALYSTISLCWTDSNIHGSSQCVGGFIGGLHESECNNSFARGNVTGGSYMGGFVGSAYNSTIINIYSTGHLPGSYGGLVGTLGNPGDRNTRDITNSYWDMETSGAANSAAGTGMLTSQMVYPYSGLSYDGWDLDTIWKNDINGIFNGGYPYLIDAPKFTPEPTFSFRPGNYSQPIELILAPAFGDEQIRYTLDGSEPTELSTLFTDFIAVDSTMTIKAKAFLPGWLPSEVIEGTYNILVGTDDEIALPATTVLYPAYPNPFKINTTIGFSLPKNTDVSLVVYNLKGQKVRSLANGAYTKGKQSIQWKGDTDNGKQAPCGMYLCKLKGNGFELTRKLTLMK
jgi:hypothetical protein